jgi:hypothetical protein
LSEEGEPKSVFGESDFWVGKGLVEARSLYWGKTFSQIRRDKDG